MKRIIASIILAFLYSNCFAAAAVIVYKRSGCGDYFVAANNQGYYLLEWYGGYDPDQGDVIAGNIDSYGMRKIAYPQIGQKGNVYVDDFGLSKSSVVEKIRRKCHLGE